MMNQVDRLLEEAFGESASGNPDRTVSENRIVILTGAGISAESGVPTFRGPEGYWKIGSKNYRPEHLATRAAFGVMPEEVWSWYLHRRWVCHQAKPNPAHRAIAELEQKLGKWVLLVTQNVDGLHLRAGNSVGRTFEIHGNLNYMRCCHPTARCTKEPLPFEVSEWPRDRTVVPKEMKSLRCGSCGGPSRPHVLWFDECYNERDFHFESTLLAAAQAQLFVVIGTAGQTSLPHQMGLLAARHGVPTLVINKDPNPFSEGEQFSRRVLLFQQGLAGELVPPLVERLLSRNWSA